MQCHTASLECIATLPHTVSLECHTALSHSLPLECQNNRECLEHLPQLLYTECQNNRDCLEHLPRCLIPIVETTVIAWSTCHSYFILSVKTTVLDLPQGFILSSSIRNVQLGLAETIYIRYNPCGEDHIYALNIRFRPTLRLTRSIKRHAKTPLFSK